MKRFAFVLAILAFVLPGVCFAGPFGFEYGMTKEQVIKLVGKENVVKDQGYFLRVTSSPKPDPDFEAYTLIISPDQGVLKIMATGVTVDTSEFGTELKASFAVMRNKLSKTYGQPTKTYDFLQPDSNMDAPAAFTQSIFKHQRVLACNWDVPADKRKAIGSDADHLIGVILNTKVLRKKAGWFEVSYEFEGFDKFYEKVQKAEEEAKKQAAQAVAAPQATHQ